MTGDTRFRSWRGRPGIVVRNFTPLERNGYLGKGDLQIRAWHLVIAGCLWRCKNGREEVVLPHRSAVGEDGKPVAIPVIRFSTKQVENRFARVALDAFRSAAAAHPDTRSPRPALGDEARKAEGSRSPRPAKAARRRPAPARRHTKARRGGRSASRPAAPDAAPRTFIPNVSDRGDFK